MPFSHEKLIVYQRSLQFIAAAEPILKRLPANASVRDQLDRAGTSIPLNLAEGNGKFSIKDRARYFQTSHGSALECAAALDVAVAKTHLSTEDAGPLKAQLEEIVAMLLALLERHGCTFETSVRYASDRVREGEGEGDEDEEGEEDVR
jgi:four helix bundle protein